MPFAPSPLWRWLVTDLCSAGISIIDHLAAERTVTPKLNEPLEMTGTVPSDNSEVNRLHTDGYPFLTEGVRLLYGFRRESDTSPFYTIRASTLLLQTTDAAASDDARTRFTGWDAWQYLFYRPIYIDQGEGNTLIPRQGYSYPYGMRADEIIIEMMTLGVLESYNNSPCGPLDLFTDYGQTAFYTGVIQSSRIPGTPTGGGWRVEPGTSIGQAIQDLCSAGYCDVVFEPIYDPVNRPGFLNQISIYAQDPADESSGAGTWRYGARFTWDYPGRSLVGPDNLYDGTQRANRVQLSRGQAGTLVNLQEDTASLDTYGEYWALQYFPQKSYDKTTVEDIAAFQLYLRKLYKQTLTVHPAPERAPRPFVDYTIGDRVPVGVTDNMRQPLPPYWPGPPASGDDTLVWQRVYGIPIDIDDNGTETVRELLVGPIGPPPPVTGPGRPGFRELGTPSSGSGLTTAVETSGGSGTRVLRRNGRIVTITPFREGVL